jgi:hypothetical protein
MLRIVLSVDRRCSVRSQSRRYLGAGFGRKNRRVDDVRWVGRISRGGWVEILELGELGRILGIGALVGSPAGGALDGTLLVLRRTESPEVGGWDILWVSHCESPSRCADWLDRVSRVASLNTGCIDRGIRGGSLCTGLTGRENLGGNLMGEYVLVDRKLSGCCFLGERHFAHHF